MSSTGIYAEDAWSRIENNFVGGGTCNTAGTGARVTRAMQALAGVTPGELDVHSNTFAAQGMAGTCQSIALDVVALAGQVTPDGVFRDNILHAGACSVRDGVREATADADPRIFQNNDVAPNGTPTAIYLDENLTTITTDVAINALTDMISSGNLSVDPMFVAPPADLHLMASSACLGAGTAVGAPAVDYDGDTRSSTAPDIGADELP
jgi:hypothetical protein